MDKSYSSDEKTTCNKCNKVMRSSYYKDHNCKQLFRCNECKKCYDHKHTLKKHLNDHFKKRLCHICGILKSHKAFKTHLLTHTEERPYTCNTCGTGFKTSVSLQHHLKLHLNDRPHICKICEATFQHITSLRYHNLTHTGEKPHMCTECDKRFTMKHRLIEHMRIHTGERPFECSYCDKNFRSKMRLKEHEKVHTEENGKIYWNKKEKWVLLWATEYAKIKIKTQRQISTEWKRIFFHHCPNKIGLTDKKFSKQRSNFYYQNVFPDNEIKEMNKLVRDMVKNNICPLTEPLEVPDDDMNQSEKSKTNSIH